MLHNSMALTTSFDGFKISFLQPLNNSFVLQKLILVTIQSESAHENAINKGLMINTQKWRMDKSVAFIYAFN